MGQQNTRVVREVHGMWCYEGLFITCAHRFRPEPKQNLCRLLCAGSETCRGFRCFLRQEMKAAKKWEDIDMMTSQREIIETM